MNACSCDSSSILAILVVRLMSTSELQRIKDVYNARISGGVISRYSLLRPGELFMAQARERALLQLMGRNGVVNVEGLKILEVGCGRGHRLLDWVRWGSRVPDLTGIDLMESLLHEARSNLPTARFVLAHAGNLPFRDASFDIVCQFTLFSSILAPEMRQAVATEMWRVLRPGGLVLWYDFRYPNPRNPDVRPVGKDEILGLFPGAVFRIRSTTLLPPLSRWLARHSALACEIASLLPVLRSHYAALLAKSSQ